MSFLAQLRQQQTPATPTGLQLCYLLRVDDTAQIHLGLHLINLVNGKLSDTQQKYTIQRQHLVMPPPFLNSADVAVLNLLAQNNDQWLHHHEQKLSDTNMGTGANLLVHRVIATEKCFAQTHEGIWKQLRLGQLKNIQPRWQLNRHGDQEIIWEPVESESTCAASWRCEKYYWFFDAEKNTLSATQSLLSEQALTLISEQSALNYSQIDSFFEMQGSIWRDCQLPLPEPLSPLMLNCIITPILVFSGVMDANGKHSDRMMLSFRYKSDRVCLIRSATNENEQERLWSGDELLVLTVNRSEEEQCTQQLNRVLNSFSECENSCSWSAPDKNTWQTLLLKKRKELELKGFQFIFEDTFKHHYVAPIQWQVNLQQDQKQWQLTLSFEADGHTIDVLDLLRQLRAFNQDLKREQIEITVDGRILILQAKLIGSLAEELADLVELYRGDMVLPLSQLYRINALKNYLPENTDWQGGNALQEQAIQLQISPVMLDRDSCDVKADLRPYQWLGVCWLQHLTNHGFNGLLADDMGLGKTLQTIAHLSLEKKCGRLSKQALIVAPTSLLANWQNELQRFCPHLRSHILHGQNRHQFWKEKSNYDVLITSYNLVARDNEQWQTLNLSWLILDEAQIIKNPRTQVSKAVRELNTQHRLCLSGTPVENHLGELWSILDFLEPGILGSQRQFNEYYQKPIEQNAEKNRLQQLLTRIAPFMLRRTKIQVAKDLPPKTLIPQSIALDEQQHTFYDDLKTLGWQQLNEQLSGTENSGQKQILLLTALTRLRQACCDPRLLGEENVPSAKTEFCLNMLQELATENRAVLVFSQFTKMLDILAAELQKLSLPYLMLTGQSKNRADLVEAFQRGDAPIFLISLKAGGVGLNLTRADTVIHFDPWWNAAAEDQATDRAHRIGQTQPVFVYKLIAQGTIEEKIARLQQAKASISQHINQNAQNTGEAFALKLEDLLALWQEDQ